MAYGELVQLNFPCLCLFRHIGFDILRDWSWWCFFLRSRFHCILFFQILNDRVIYFLLVLICAFCGTLWRWKQVVNTAQVTSLGSMWMMQNLELQPRKNYVFVDWKTASIHPEKWNCALLVGRWYPCKRNVTSFRHCWSIFHISINYFTATSKFSPRVWFVFSSFMFWIMFCIGFSLTKQAYII